MMDLLWLHQKALLLVLLVKSLSMMLILVVLSLFQKKGLLKKVFVLTPYHTLLAFLSLYIFLALIL